MKVSIKEIKKLLTNTLLKNGVDRNDVKLIMEDYLEGELLGKVSHGLMAFPSIVKKASSMKKKIKIVKQTSSYAFIDGQGYFGQVAANKAIELAIKKAKKNGIAMVGMNNIVAFLTKGIHRYGVPTSITAKDFEDVDILVHQTQQQLDF